MIEQHLVTITKTAAKKAVKLSIHVSHLSLNLRLSRSSNRLIQSILRAAFFAATAARLKELSIAMEEKAHIKYAGETKRIQEVRALINENTLPSVDDGAESQNRANNQSIKKGEYMKLSKDQVEHLKWLSKEKSPVTIATIKKKNKKAAVKKPVLDQLKKRALISTRTNESGTIRYGILQAGKKAIAPKPVKKAA